MNEQEDWVDIFLSLDVMKVIEVWTKIYFPIRDLIQTLGPWTQGHYIPTEKKVEREVLRG